MNRRKPSKQDREGREPTIHADRTPEEIADHVEVFAGFSYGEEAKERTQTRDIPEPTKYGKVLLLTFQRTSWEQCGPGVLFLPRDSRTPLIDSAGVAFFPRAMIADMFPASVVEKIELSLPTLDYRTTFILVMFFADLNGLIVVRRYHTDPEEPLFFAKVPMA